MTDEKTNQPKKSYTTPVILVAVCLLTAVLFGYSIWAEKTNKNAASDETLGGLTSGVIEDNTNINTSAAVNMTDAQREQARIRDSKRLADIKTLLAALEVYKKDKGYYPETFGNLKPGYLSDIPQNPAPGSAEYVYTGIGTTPYSYYEISYALEVGAEGIEAGVHVASPSNVALW